ncbi:ras-related protein rabc2a [Quercus suber]|uniref:Ras-related protein rabc2a n=1 Tax=Quercus suber TaxID=58331 RepID=A0AAW0LXT6_QUESU
MSMARSNFYAVNHNYRPRLTLFGKDSGDDVITAASTESYMSMARSNFYAVNHNYRPRLTLFGKDSGDDVITAASTGVDFEIKLLTIGGRRLKLTIWDKGNGWNYFEL